MKLRLLGSRGSFWNLLSPRVDENQRWKQTSAGQKQSSARFRVWAVTALASPEPAATCRTMDQSVGSAEELQSSVDVSTRVYTHVYIHTYM